MESLRLALKFHGLKSNWRIEDIMKENMKWAIYSINRKTLMELYDSMHKRVEAAFKAKEGSTQY